MDDSSERSRSRGPPHQRLSNYRCGTCHERLDGNKWQHWEEINTPPDRINLLHPTYTGEDGRVWAAHCLRCRIMRAFCQVLRDQGMM